MKIKFISLFSLFFLVRIIVFAGNVSIITARQTAKNFYCEKTDIKQEQIIFAEEYTMKDGDTNLYYIFNVQNNSGFVIVSADDTVKPIFGYSLNNNFGTKNQPENIIFWMQQYKEQILYVKEANLKASSEVKKSWQKYNASSSSFIKNSDKDIVVDALTGDITWNQGNGWNDLCPEDQTGPGGNVYAGCVATAMGIVLKYWEYPIQGSGSHGYNPSGYDYQSVDYGETTYFWSYMEDDSPNYYSALLLYHLGVSVDMMYGANGSGAYSFDVPSALESYFCYDSNISYVSRSNYSDSDWGDLLKAQLNDSKPMYYSGCSESGCHAIVCDGYDSDDLFHYNFGWSGSSNGFYSLDNVGGYSNYNAAVINIQPPESYNVKSPVESLSAELDFEQENKVTLEWENVIENNKLLSGYTLYRNEEIIEENISVSDNSYIDSDVPEGEYFYGIRAIYSDGDALCASDFVDVKNNFIVTLRIRNENQEIIYPVPNATLNGETIMVNFAGNAVFNNVEVGTNYNYTIEHPDYFDIEGTIDVNSDERFDITMYLGTSVLGVDNEILIYPNPSNTGIFNLKNYNETTNIVISDLTGRVIYNSVLKNNQINLSDCSKGVYILKADGNTEMLIYR